MRAPAQTTAAGFPKEMAGADMIEPLPLTWYVNRHFIVISDYFTIRCWAIPLPKPVGWASAKTINKTGLPGGVSHANFIQAKARHTRVSPFKSHILNFTKTPVKSYFPQGKSFDGTANKTIKGHSQSSNYLRRWIFGTYSLLNFCQPEQ
ncbi:hypothetical protein FGIG_09750 [Fasciola gigantica]|uniref:Uncharacterized protein n=1 Tax=Fasciola gigantica TaxID=46835 RepID=A0A504YR75_FASGI|nr:hypothetical protein FGIG_09750 [Fasciola gigantica]